MSRTDQHDHAAATTAGGGPFTRAWIAVALVPVAFILALAVGEGLYSLMGYPTGNTLPLWVDLVASAAALGIFLVPCVAAVLFGRRATGAGERRGWVPLAVGACAGLGMTILTVVTLISTPHV